MSEGKQSNSTSAVGTADIMGPTGKTSVATPKLSDDEHVEMEEIISPGSPVNPDEDIMQLARLGDIQGIEKLFGSGKFDGTYADAEGITPLHVCVYSAEALGQLLISLAVGCYQQPIRHVPVPLKGWRRCQ